jgi:hypothetical protein
MDLANFLKINPFIVQYYQRSNTALENALEFCLPPGKIAESALMTSELPNTIKLDR